MRNYGDGCSQLIEQQRYSLLALCDTYGEIADIPVAAAERRSDDRAKVRVYRSAILRWRRFEGLCLIRNISPGGLMATLHADIEYRERVVVEIRSGSPIEGSVAWSRDGQVGIQFDDRIDVVEVLHGQPMSKRARAPRTPRLRIACQAHLTVDGTRQSSTLIDISQGGAMVEADSLRPDMHVTLTIPGLGPKRGVVRWADENRADIGFIAPIGFDPLAQWALARQAGYGIG